MPAAHRLVQGAWRIREPAHAGHSRSGVVAASGGNHGAAVAYAAMRLGVPATIFLPSVTSPSKVERIRSYAANLIVAGDRYADALAASERYGEEHGALGVHAFDQPQTLLGQGTVGCEIDAGPARHRHAAGGGRRRRIDRRHRRAGFAVGSGSLRSSRRAPRRCGARWRPVAPSMPRPTASRRIRWRPGASARSCFRSRRRSSNAPC